MRHHNDRLTLEMTSAELATALAIPRPYEVGTRVQLTDGLKLIYVWDGANWIQSGMGAGTCWVDIDIPLIPKVTGAGTPAYTTIQGNITALNWAVNDALSSEGVEFVHKWKEGTAVYVHIHLWTNGADINNRYTKWTFEYAWASPNGVMSAATLLTSGELLIPLNTTTKTHFMYQIGNFTPAGVIGAQLVGRLKRIAAVGTAPTANPWVSMCQMHVECDTIGSKTASAK